MSFSQSRIHSSKIQLQMGILKPSFCAWSIVFESIKAILELSWLETPKLNNIPTLLDNTIKNRELNYWSNILLALETNG